MRGHRQVIGTGNSHVMSLGASDERSRQIDRWADQSPLFLQVTDAAVDVPVKRRTAAPPLSMCRWRGP